MNSYLDALLKGDSTDKQIERLRQLRERGVVILDPARVYVAPDVPLDNIEAGAILMNAMIFGRETMIGRGSVLGLGGNVTLTDCQLGRDVELTSGYAESVTLLDKVKVRGYAELRGGTLMEEESEGAHTVGFKMTIFAPFVVAGSCINYCDVYMAGGSSRQYHSEIGSGAIHYNFDPAGDKWASLLGDVPRGVFLRQHLIFIGGQTQVIAPVKIDYGAVVIAGSPVRRTVEADTLYAETHPEIKMPSYFQRPYGALFPKFQQAAEYIGNMQALFAWYGLVRHRLARDPFEARLFQAGLRQVESHIRERINRLEKIIKKLPASIAMLKQENREKLALQQARMIERWPQVKALLESPPLAELASEQRVFADLLERDIMKLGPNGIKSYPDTITGLSDDTVSAGTAWLQRIVAVTMLASKHFSPADV
jgi:UDP-N-acetylglucosamine/UDP-N-acetylgalactosamine diphosphorylase